MSDLPALDGFTPESLRRRGSAKWSHYDPDVTAAWIAEMDFPAAPEVRRAVLEAVHREEFGYPSMAAEQELAEAVAAWQQERHGWTVDPADVHGLPDVLKAIELGIERFSPTDSAVIIPTPSYPPFFEVVRAARRPIVEAPVVRDAGGVRRLDLEAIDAAFAAGAGTLILCHPHNPLGRSFTVAELTAVADVVERHGGRVVADEVHAPLTYPGGRHVPYASVSDAAAGHAVTLVSASKAWNVPGLKCAQLIVSNGRDAARWRAVPFVRTHGASTVGIRANIAAYRHGQPWLETVLAYLDGNRRLLGELLAAHLPGVGYDVPEATYLAWLDCSALGLGSEPAAFFLDAARVATSAGSDFGAGGADHLRFNFATSRAILERAVEAMGRAVKAVGTAVAGR